MLSLLAQITLLITGETGGVSGRQVDPLLPQFAAANISASGFKAVTNGARACFPQDLAAFGPFLASSPQRTEGEAAVMFRWQQSWLVSPRPSEQLLKALGAKDVDYQAARWERWHRGDQELRCITLPGHSSELPPDLGDWEIRWFGEAELAEIGRVTELARPLGDGSRRLRRIRGLVEENPELLWFDMGGLFEGRSLIRDGLDMHRRVTAAALRKSSPRLLLPSQRDLAGGLEHLLSELQNLPTDLLVTGHAKAEGRLLNHWESQVGGQPVMVLGLGHGLPAEKEREQVEEALSRAQSNGSLVIVLSRSTHAALPLLGDPRVHLLAYPGPVRLGAFEGTWRREPKGSGGPFILPIAPNRLLKLSYQEGAFTFQSEEINESTPGDPTLARQVNRVRHVLYPRLNQVMIPGSPAGQPETTFTVRQTEDLLARVLLRSADADAVLLPPLASQMETPGPVSRMELRARLSLDAQLVRRRVEGQYLQKATAHFGSARLNLREKIKAGVPLRLVTTADLARKLKPHLGPAEKVEPLQRVERRLLPAPPAQAKESSFRDVTTQLLDGELLWDSPEEAVLRQRVAKLMTMPSPRARLRLRIDSLSISLQEVSLRAPVARRAPEDPRANSPTRLSVGSRFDLRLEQPLRDLLLTARSLGEYRRESFPAELGVEAIDKEAVDDLRGILEIAAREGAWRPFASIGLDSEFTAGDPSTENPGPRQILNTIDAGLIVPKRGTLHEARISGTALRDFSRQLAAIDPQSDTALPDWRFGVSALADLRKSTRFGSFRFLLGGRLFLPETEPQPNTLYWAFSERLEYSFPLLGGLHLKIYGEHFAWRTHGSDPAPAIADTWLSGGLSLDFSRVMRPLAGLF